MTEPTAPSHAAKIDQIVKWTAEGQSDHLIREAIEGSWPNDDAEQLLSAASEAIDKAGGWDLAAAKYVYQKAIEIGDFSQAERSLKEIERLGKSRNQPQPTTTELIDPKRAARDCNLINRAVTNGWSIPAEIMADLPQLLDEVVRNGDPRAKVAAARVLVSMASQNQKAKPAPVKRIKHIHTVSQTEESIDDRKRRLAERIAGLGDDPGRSGSGPAAS